MSGIAWVSVFVSLSMAAWLFCGVRYAQTIRLSSVQKPSSSNRGSLAVYALSIGWAVAVFVTTVLTNKLTSTALSELMRTYGFTALGLLVVLRLPGLFHRTFYGTFVDGVFWPLRKSLGLSAMFFGVLHAAIGFFHNLAGRFDALQYVSVRHQIAIVFALSLLLVMSAMAVLSFATGLVRRYGWLRKLYAVGPLLVVAGGAHAFLIGSDLTLLQRPLSFAVLCILLLIVGLELALKAQMIVATAIERRSCMTSIAAGVVLLLFVLMPFAVQAGLNTAAARETARLRDGKGHQH